MPMAIATPVREGTADSRASTLVRPHRRNKAPAPPPPPSAVAPVSGPEEMRGVAEDTPSEASESDPLYSVATARRPPSLDTTDGSVPPPVPEKRFDLATEERKSEDPVSHSKGQCFLWGTVGVRRSDQVGYLKEPFLKHPVWKMQGQRAHITMYVVFFFH